VNYEHKGEHLTYDINPFYSYLVDFIYLERGEGQVEGFDLYEYAQYEQAQLYEIDLSVNDHPYFAHGFHVESAYNYVRGEVLSLTSFSLMPQSILNSVLKYNFNDGEKWKRKHLAIQHQYFLPKMLVSSF
jgi:hypothetical protein